MSGELEPGIHDRIRVQRNGLDALVHQPLGQVGVVRRPLAADAHVLAELVGCLDRHRQQLLDRRVPLVEGVGHQARVAVEAEGQLVIPTARAAQLTMDREGIRRLAAETLRLPTSPYRFCDDREAYLAAVQALGYPCVVKPLMSSSGKGQSLLRSADDIESAWNYAQEGGRAGGGRVIVEGFVNFDFEITLLTVRHRGGTSFCEPIGHYQVDGDYRESWQPQPMSAVALERAQEIARAVTDNLGGRGVFGIELFVCGDEVLFSEVSPRPHDTGLVTLIGQDLSQFALHVRAILGLPIPAIRQRGACASAALVAEGHGKAMRYHGLDRALAEPDTELRLFGKPEVQGQRRVAVCLARGDDLFSARERARRAAEQIRVEFG